MDMGVAEMAAASRIADYDVAPAPPVWGAAWRHAFYGFTHHADVMFRNHAYPHFRPHREHGPWRELGLYLKRMMIMPALAPERRWRERRLLSGGRLYHLVLLQMAIDSSMRAHSRFASVSDFIAHCLAAFAAGAPRDHHIVFKTYPFEDGRERLEARARALARELGLQHRVLFLNGGRLGPLLDRARSAVTVNSTAGQQALWRGLPLFAEGRAVYGKPEFTASGRSGRVLSPPYAAGRGGLSRIPSIPADELATSRLILHSARPTAGGGSGGGEDARPARPL